jgi:FkbM family methyltransferase
MLKRFIAETGNLNLVDMGCRGGVAPKWEPIQAHLNVVGFDASKEECDRLSRLPHPYLSAVYLPYAIGGDNGSHTLYIARTPECSSLLKPNRDWLDRLSLGDGFDIIASERVDTKTLDSIPELAQIDIDIVKSDTQGMEWPILLTAGEALKKAFYVEVETVFGSNEGYIGEAPYGKTEELMLSNHFLLFDIITHRIPRNNVLKDAKDGEQIYYCETVWLKDYLALYKSDKLDKEYRDRRKALKALILCAVQGCLSYGYELAQLYKDLGIISSDELQGLGRRSNWLLDVKQEKSVVKRVVNRGVNCSLRLLPRSLRSTIRHQAELAERQKHLLRRSLS